MVTNRRGPPFELFAQLLVRLAHLGIAHMHLSEEMIRQPTVVVQATQIRAANVTHLQFLVPRWAGRVLKVLQFPFARLFLMFRSADFMQFVERLRDRACFAHDGDLEKAAVDGFGQV